MSVSLPPLVVGTMVSTILYNRGRGYVAAVHDPQRTDPSRRHSVTPAFDVVFEDASVSYRLPEAVLRGVQWRVYPREEGFAEAATLSCLLADAQAARAQAEAATRMAQEAEMEAIASLRSDPAWASLIQSDTGDGTIAAKNIRALLKTSFPETKFSVRKLHYGALKVTWEAGPTRDAVCAVTSRFASGTYDAHTDCHGSCLTPWMRVFGHADHIFLSRG